MNVDIDLLRVIFPPSYSETRLVLRSVSDATPTFKAEWSNSLMVRQVPSTLILSPREASERILAQLEMVREVPPPLEVLESRVVSLLTPWAMRLVIRRFGVKKIMNSLPMVSTKPVNMNAPGRGGAVTLIEMPRLEARFSDAQGLIFLDDLLEEERVAKTLTWSHHALKTASTYALGNNGKNTVAQPTPSSHLTLLNDMNLLLNLRATACTHQDHWTCVFGRSTLGCLGYIQNHYPVIGRRKSVHYLYIFHHISDSQTAASCEAKCQMHHLDSFGPVI
jgi:hypothetical protein